MNPIVKKLLELLEAKFQGARKDGLQQLANSLALTVTTEDEATALVGKLTAEAVDGYIKDWRKAADAENSKAAQTREDTLRAKYELTEKQPKPDPTPKPTPTDPNDIQRIVKEAVAAATKDLQAAVANMTNSNLTNTRRGQIEAMLNQHKDLSESYRKTIMQGFEGRTFESDEAFNTYLEQTKTNTAAFVQEMADRQLATTKPVMGEPDKNGVSQGVADFIKARTDTKGNPLGGKEI